MRGCIIVSIVVGCTFGFLNVSNTQAASLNAQCLNPGLQSYISTNGKTNADARAAAQAALDRYDEALESMAQCQIRNNELSPADALEQEQRLHRQYALKLQGQLDKYYASNVHAPPRATTDMSKGTQHSKSLAEVQSQVHAIPPAETTPSTSTNSLKSLTDNYNAQAQALYQRKAAEKAATSGSYTPPRSTNSAPSYTPPATTYSYGVTGTNSSLWYPALSECIRIDQHAVVNRCGDRSIEANWIDEGSTVGSMVTIQPGGSYPAKAVRAAACKPNDRYDWSKNMCHE